MIDEFRPDVVHTNAVQGLSSVALTRPRQRGVAHVHTLHDYWLLCQRNSMVHRDGRSCEPRCRSCVGISWIRNEAIRRSPPGVVLAVSQAIAAEHEQIRLGRAAPAGALQPGRGRRRLPRPAARRRPTADVRVPRPARPRQGRGNDARARSLAPGFRTRGWSSPVVGRSRPTVRDGRAVGRRRRLGRPGAQGGPARRPGLPGRAVAVEGPGAGRGERGSGPGHPGHRCGDRGDPRADRRPSAEPLLFPPADAGALADRMLAFAAAPERFRPEPDGGADRLARTPRGGAGGVRARPVGRDPCGHEIASHDHGAWR